MSAIRLVTLLVGAFVALSMLSTVASAQSAAEVDKAFEECMAAHEADPNLDPLDGPPNCTIGPNGEFTRSYDFAAPDSGSIIGAFIVFGLLWSAIPLFIAGTMASNRGESVGTALLLTLFLGWIGLAIVYFGQDKTRAAAAGVIQPGSAPAYATAGADDPAERLTRIDQLWREGVITDAERNERRAAILDQL